MLRVAVRARECLLERQCDIFVGVPPRHLPKVYCSGGTEENRSVLEVMRDAGCPWGLNKLK